MIRCLCEQGALRPGNRRRDGGGTANAVRMELLGALVERVPDHCRVVAGARCRASRPRRTGAAHGADRTSTT